MKVKGMKVAQKAQIFFILLIVLIPLFSAASYGCLYNSHHIPMKKNSDVILDFCYHAEAWVDPNYIPIPPKKWEVLQSMYPRTWIDDFTNLDNYRHVNYSIAG